MQYLHASRSLSAFIRPSMPSGSVADSRFPSLMQLRLTRPAPCPPVFRQSRSALLMA
ncbi:hypothetical protein NK639_21895 [Pseudomonas sp. ZM24]|uniref:hypothetical protein n=1 Tax=Pseudomonas triclosanedens TaxID=2961893 RepID=UPI0020C22644|nr:hypothetical protein [Pseudomonas triclosanedens]MCP8472791.1 hypothetical protein [Pseudomonas triclosanedens]MCP8478222.1 hypothetical protein [Pseudomonas triclosanedens]